MSAVESLIPHDASRVPLRTVAAVAKLVESCESWEDLTSKATPLLLEQVLSVPTAQVEAFLHVLKILEQSFSQLRIEDNNGGNPTTPRRSPINTLVEVDITEFVTRIANLAIATAWDRSGLPPAHVVLTGLQSVADGNTFEDALWHAMEASQQGFCNEVPLGEAAIDLSTSVAMAPFREEVLRNCQRKTALPKAAVYVLGALYFSTNVSITTGPGAKPPQPSRSSGPLPHRALNKKHYTWPFTEENEGLDVPSTAQLGTAVKNVQGALSEMFSSLF